MKHDKHACGVFLLLWENKQIKRLLFKVLVFNIRCAPVSVDGVSLLYHAATSSKIKENLQMVLEHSLSSIKRVTRI